MTTHLAIDIGGSRGRVFLGTQDGGTWSTEFLGDFSTQPIKQNGRLCWDVSHIFSSICYYLKKSAAKVLHLDTIAVDTMGVAFALLDSGYHLIELPPYTRTAQSPESIDEILCHFTPDGLYQINGLEQQKLNSLYYLHQIAKERPFVLQKTAHFLMLPDLLNYWLTGVMESEYTIASTSALWDVSKNDWSDAVLDSLHLSKDVFPKVVHAPAIVAPLKKELISAASLHDTKVVHVCSHDTASACSYVSTFSKNNVFISAGTYGIIGAVTSSPCLTTAAREKNFANEGTFDGQILFLNNAPNLSILKCCLDEWFPLQSPDYQRLFRPENFHTACRSILDLHHPYMKQKSHMPELIQRYCHETGQDVPKSQSDILYVIIHSIVHNYVQRYMDLCELTDQTYDTAVIVGGGAKNHLLIQLLQDMLPIPVMVIQEEATTLGNLFLQLEALT